MKTNKEFLEDLKEEVGEEHTPLEEYKGSSTKIKIRHEVCGNVYMVKPGRILYRGSRCPACYATTRKSQEEFEEEVKEKGNDEYEVLGEYKNYNTKVKLKHKKCGYAWSITPASFLSAGTRCPICTKRKGEKDFKAELKNITDGKISSIGKYKDGNTKIKFQCNRCGYVFKRKPNKVLEEKVYPRCPRCEEKEKRQERVNNFKDNVKDTVGGEYKVIGKYTGFYSKIKMKHNKCGTKFKVIPSNFLYANQRCPNCSTNRISKGEAKIEDFLDNRNISYEKNYTFDDCRHHYALQFDFAIFEKDKYGRLFEDTLLYLIEYNGIQHYKAIDYFGGEERLKHQKEHDKVKKEYCEDNGIPLLVIKYTEKKNIEEMLTKNIL
ncbi:MAG: hypothetical protein ACOC56_06130 [Atribacterota bacterium]